MSITQLSAVPCFGRRFSCAERMIRAGARKWQLPQLLDRLNRKKLFLNTTSSIEQTQIAPIAKIYAKQKSRWPSESADASLTLANATLE